MENLEVTKSKVLEKPSLQDHILSFLYNVDQVLCPFSFSFFIFKYFLEGSPSTNARLQGAHHLSYNIKLQKNNIYYYMNM